MDTELRCESEQEAMIWWPIGYWYPGIRNQFFTPNPAHFERSQLRRRFPESAHDVNSESKLHGALIR